MSLFFLNKEFCFKNKSNDAKHFIAKAIEMHIALWCIASHGFTKSCQVRKVKQTNVINQMLNFVICWLEMACSKEL